MPSMPTFNVSNTKPTFTEISYTKLRTFPEAMSDDPDFEYLIVDSTIVRAHQHAAGAKKGGLKIRRLAVRAAA
jgi:hypothetical protein